MKKKYETFANHMKGFKQGLYLILIIIIIIIFFQFIAYLDRTVGGNTYHDGDDTEIEYFNEDNERSEGIRDSKGTSQDNPIYEQRKKDFGSKSLNQKDKEELEKDKQEKDSKSYDYLDK